MRRLAFRHHLKSLVMGMVAAIFDPCGGFIFFPCMLRLGFAQYVCATSKHFEQKASNYAEEGGRLTSYIDLVGEDGLRAALLKRMPKSARRFSGCASKRIDRAFPTFHPEKEMLDEILRSKKMAAIPFDQRVGFIWLDGEFVDWKDAKFMC